MKMFSLICCLGFLLVGANSYAFDSAPQPGGTTTSTTTTSAANNSPIDAGFYASLAFGANLSSTSSYTFAGASAPTTAFGTWYNLGGDYDLELGTVLRPKSNKDLFFVLAVDYQLLTAAANTKYGAGYANHTYNLFNILGVLKFGYYIPQTDFFGYLKGGIGLGLYDFEDAVALPTNTDTWTALAYTYGIGVGYGRIAQAFIELSNVTETSATSSIFPTEFSATGATKDSFNYMQILFGVNFAVY